MAIHPGRILKRELNARGLSSDELALASRVPPGRITSTLDGRHSITPDTASCPAYFFGNSARFWTNLQTRYELRQAEAQLGGLTVSLSPSCRSRRNSVPTSMKCAETASGRFGASDMRGRPG